MNSEAVIENTTMSLLATTPIDHVTINMVVEASDVSKATFYRHYLDKYDLVNHLFDRLIPASYHELGYRVRFADFLQELLDNLRHSASFVDSLLHSECRESLKKHMEKSLAGIVKCYLNRVGIPLSEEDKMSSSVYYGLTIAHSLIYWNENGWKEASAILVEHLLNDAPHLLYSCLNK